MLKSKTMQSLLGIFVLAAVVFALMNLWWTPTFGKFACSYEPAFLGAGQAHAAEDDCPTSIRGATNDAQWAADRIAEIDDEKLTTGLLFDEDGMPHRFDSSRDADSDHALETGRSAGVFPKSGRPMVVDHVEVKVAAAMQTGDVRTGVLVINNQGGPCRRNAQGQVEPASCLAFLPKLLPKGTTLTVWWPDPKGGNPTKQTFVGGQ